MTKFSNGNFFGRKDIQVNDDNVNNYQEPYHDESIEEPPPKPPVESEFRRYTIERQVS